jgi:hypothetical protein
MACDVLRHNEFLIVAGVHNHGGGTSGGGYWITLRPNIGDKCWHLNLFRVDSTNGNQDPVTINNEQFVLSGGSFGIGSGGSNICLNYLDALVAGETFGDITSTGTPARSKASKRGRVSAGTGEKPRKAKLEHKSP